MSLSTTIAATCANCGAALQGRFCHACGQKAVGHQLTIRDLLHEALHEFANFDGKIVQTAKRLVFSPGFLTNEFLAGRRARYISPIRVYLTCSLLFFGLAALAPNTSRSVITVTRSDSNARPADAGQHQLTNDEVRDRIGESFVHTMPRVMFVLMPVFALLTWAFYRKRQPYYVAHVYHAIHFHAFVFLLMAAWILFALGGHTLRAIANVLPLVACSYYYVSLSRVFGGSLTQTIVKGTIIGMLYGLAISGALIGLIMIVLKASAS